MKFILPLTLILFVALMTNCTKSSAPYPPINCDGLVTDTAGSGDNGRVYMPNAFTPNGDGLNEISLPITQNIDSIQFTLYDEFNAVVFTTDIVGDGFIPVPGGPLVKKYYYKIQTTTFSHKKIGICGEVYSLTCFTTNPPKNFYYFEDMFTGSGFSGTTAETLTVCK